MSSLKNAREIRDLKRRVDELEETVLRLTDKIETLAYKRGPGRPKKGEHNVGAVT